MPDRGERATEREYAALKRKITKEYKQAYKEVAKKGEDFLAAHKDRDAKYRQMVESGDMSKADYAAWLRGQVFQGKQWEARKKQMADTLYSADQAALQMTNKARFNVFAANANYTCKQINKDIGANVSFHLYDAHTVQRLVKDNPDILPPRSIGKDKAYRWYNQRMNNAVTQGIIQGESIADIALRIGRETGESELSAMLRNARTGFTGAQNAGRIEGLHQAEELGIRVQKQWMATLDNRTRDTHADLDGQVVDVDEPFITSAGNEIMYPGDPDADPSEVWNCRCTLVYVYPGYENDMERRDNETGEIVGDMTYREWEALKKGEGEEPESEKPEPTKEPERPVDYFDMETTREISSAMSEAIGRPVDLQGMDKTLAARTARLYTDLGDEYGMRASSIGMNNRRAAFGQVNHKYTGEKKLTFSKSMFESPEKLREVLMGEQRKGQTIPIRGGVILDYVQTHEFAHLFGSSLEDGYYNANQPFWREVGAVMREYIDDRTRPLGKYAAQNIDEFMAEAFADGYLNRQPTEYGRKVKAIVDKYFSRRR